VRGADSIANTSNASITVVLSRAEVASGCTSLADVDAAANTAFSLAILCGNGTDAATLHLSDGPPYAPIALQLPTPTALTVEIGGVAREASGDGWVLTIEESPFVSSAAGVRGVVARPFDTDSFTAVAEVAVPGDGVDVADVVDLDVALLSNGLPIALLRSGDDRLYITVRDAGGSWTTPLEVSDATTLLPRAPRIAVGSDDAVTAAWIEVDDRDGDGGDEDDVVAVRTLADGTPQDAIAVVTEDDGAYADGATIEDLALVALPGAAHQAVVAFVDGGDAWLATLSGEPLGPTNVDVVTASGDVAAIGIALHAGELLVGVIDDGAVDVYTGAADALGAPFSALGTGATPPILAVPAHVVYEHGANIAVRALPEVP
jgi:hypothetical protein